MERKIYPSFDFASLSFDFAKKEMKVDYPFKPTGRADFFIFTLLFIFGACVLVGVLDWVLGSFHLEITYDWVFFLLTGVLYAIWMLYCYKVSTVRKRLIESMLDRSQENQILLYGELPRRHVKIVNLGNMNTEWYPTGDYSEYLQKFEIKCTRKRKIRKFGFSFPRYKWEGYLTFSKRPKKGKMLILNQRSGFDEVNGNGNLDLVFY